MKGLLSAGMIAILCIAVPMQVKAQDAELRNPFNLDSLLKYSEFSPVANGNERVIYVNAEDETSMVIVSERQISEKDPNLDFIYIYTKIASVPEGFTHPQALLYKLATMNDETYFGRYGINDKDKAVYYCSSLWLNTTTVAVFEREMYMAHFQRLAAKKLVTPFLEE